MNRISTLGQGLYSDLCMRGLSRGIVTFGYFGSGAYSDSVEDFDFLMIVEDDPGRPADVSHIISCVERRFWGDYSLGMPQDRSVPLQYARVAIKFADRRLMELDWGVGPANLTHATRPWIHLNGPMSLEVWAAFCRRFPIQATIIQNNYTPIVGQVLHHLVPPITISEIIQYKADMDTRFAVIPMSGSYCRKLIKAAAMICGQRSCQLIECVETLEERGLLTRAGAEVILRATDHTERVAPEFTSQMQLLWSRLLSRHAAGDASAPIAVGSSNGRMNGVAERPNIKQTSGLRLRGTA